MKYERPQIVRVFDATTVIQGSIHKPGSEFDSDAATSTAYEADE
jgi:hypothetical protein